MSGVRAPRRRYEPVPDEEEKIIEDGIAVGDAVEEVGDEVEEVGEEVEAVAGASGGVVSEEWVLPASVEGLEAVILREAVYGGCLVELRRVLRERGELDQLREREIAREIRYVRARLYEYGLRLARLGGCRNPRFAVVKRLCELLSNPPRWAVTESVEGAENPAVLLQLLKRYLPSCYEAVTGRAAAREDYGLRALSV